MEKSDDVKYYLDKIKELRDISQNIVHGKENKITVNIGGEDFILTDSNARFYASGIKTALMICHPEIYNDGGSIT